MTNSRGIRRRCWIALAILAVLLLATVLLGPTIAKPFVRAKLQAMIRDQLNARLDVGSLTYAFPYGVTVGDARLVAADADGREFDLLSAKALSIQLAKIPLGRGPLVIRSVAIDSPLVHIILTKNGIVGRGITVKADQPVQERSEKLSRMFQLERLALTDGNIVYEDRTVTSAVPLAWRGLQVDLQTGARTGTDYAFDLTAGAGKAATLSAKGSFDIDDLIIHLELLGVRVNVDPDDATDSPLPADLQPLLREYQVRGALAIDFSGDLPLNDPKRARMTATIDLPRAVGRLPGAQSPLDELSAKIVASVGAIGVPSSVNQASVLKVNIERFIARGRDASITFDGGTLVWNDATRAWGASGAKFSLAAGKDRTALPRSIVELLDRVHASGGIACTLDGSGAIDANGTASLKQTEARVTIAPKDLTIHPPRLALPLTDFADLTIRIGDGIATIENARAGFGDDVLLVSKCAVRCDELPAVIRVNALRGCVTFAKQLAAYPEPVAEYLIEAQPHGPFWFAGNARIDLTRPADDPAAVDYLVRVTTDRGSFSTKRRHLPLHNVNLDVVATPTAIAINRFNADVLSGKLSLTGNVDLKSAEPSYAAQVRLRGVDLNSLAQLFATPEEKPLTIAGVLSADVTLSGRGFDEKTALDALHADGAMQVINGELLRIPVLDRIADQVGRTQLATVAEAGSTFTLDHRMLQLSDAVVGSPALGVRGGGEIGLDGSLALNLIATPLNNWDRQVRRENGSAVRNTVATVAGQVQDGLNSVTEKYLYRLKVTGNVSQPDVRVVAAPSLQEK